MIALVMTIIAQIVLMVIIFGRPTVQQPVDMTGIPYFEETNNAFHPGRQRFRWGNYFGRSKRNNRRY
jgi:hypothetical protein